MEIQKQEVESEKKIYYKEVYQSSLEQRDSNKPIINNIDRLLHKQEMNIEIENILKKLHSPNQKMEGLDDMSNALASGYSTATFLGQLEPLFAGFRSCLGYDTAQGDVIMKANTVLLEMISDIQHSDDLELQFAQLVPSFIENLGNSKAPVRKSTHKCIATYVKISKKLEFVLLHLINSGLDSSCTRTRQHSMLVIPALISLKPIIVDKASAEAVELMQRVIKRLRDPQEIVAKTARKLLLELQKCYPAQFEHQLVAAIPSEDDKIICKAVLRNDEDEIQRILATVGQNPSQNNKRSGGLDESKTITASQSTYSSGVNHSGKGAQLGPSKELSIIGKEILQSNNPNSSSQIGHHSIMASSAQSQIGSMQMLDKIINEAKEESRYPQGPNGLYFGFLEEELIEALNENNQWKERTSSIEAIESQLNQILSSDRKVEFHPFATSFMGFIIQYIPDINFKISLTTIKIIQRLLQQSNINFKKYYQQLTTSLIEKLSDSKVVIRQAVLKACSQLIVNYKATTFAYHAMKYLTHGNWHVREGAVQLIAHCVISQSMGPFKNSQAQINQMVPQTPDSDIPLSLNTTMIQELCNQIQTEDKQKIQQTMIDVLALMIELSGNDTMKSTILIAQGLGIMNNFKSHDEILNSQSGSKEFILMRQIIERLFRGNLPFINEESIVEFPNGSGTSSSTNMLQGAGGHHKIGQGNSFKNDDMNSSDFSAGQSLTPQVGYPPQQETFASNLNKLPSQGFIDQKRKEEEKRALMRSEQQQEAPVNDGNPEKIAMWLPSFSHSSSTGNTQQYPKGKNVRNQPNNSKGESFSQSGNSYIDDGKNMNSYTNQMAFSESKGGYGQSLGLQQQQMKSPNYSESKVYSSIGGGPNSSLSTNLPTHSTFNSSSQMNQNMNGGGGLTKMGYTPESHMSKPRNINSNEIRQRTMDGPAISSQFSKSNGMMGGGTGTGGPSTMMMGGNDTNQDFQYDFIQQKGMSHSSGGMGGFGMNSSASKGGAQVTDRLKLLKQKQNSTQSADKPRREFMGQQQYSNEQDVMDDDTPSNYSNSLVNSGVGDRMKGFNQNSMGPAAAFVAKKQLNMQGNGPVRALHKEDDAITSIYSNNQNQYSEELNMTPNIMKTKKPPLTKQPASVTKIQSRAQSVDNTPNSAGDGSPSSAFQGPGQTATDGYNLVEEPLPNPDKQYQMAIDQLKSGDWAKQFEACNTIKRIAMFHKNLLAANNPLQMPLFKELVKLIENLRSQLAKNTMLTIYTVFENINSKELEHLTDTLIPPLLKKAADTNAFLAESADQALVSLCYQLPETRILNCLQSCNIKSNPMKLKLALCYNTLIEKLGGKIRQSREMERLIQGVALLLNEGAIEVRNMAKIGLLTLKNNLGSQRELEAILNRCVTNEKQLDKIKQMIQKNDFDSISNTGSTRYGSSMRTSSLDSRSAGQFRAGSSGANPQKQAMMSSGTESFGQFTHSSDFNVPGGSAYKPGGPPGGLNTTENSNSFKKSNLQYQIKKDVPQMK